MKELRTTDELIITVSPGSNFHGKEANPAMPYSPEELTEAIYESWNEGASIAHIHCRDEDGIPTNDPEIFQEVDKRIRGKGCDIIIQHSTSPATRPGATVDDGMKSLEPNPEMADLCRSKELEVIECFVEQASSLHAHVDLVVALEVIEHVHDPLDFCRSLNHLIRGGGRLLLTGLSVDGFDSQILWEHAKSISPPHHINFMSILGFERLLSRAGFSDIRVSTPGQLDVDIVKGALAETPDLLKDNKFVRHLLERGESTLSAFQRFLADNQLSSHCWVWAAK